MTHRTGESMNVPPPYPPAPPAAGRVPNHLVWAILATLGATLICCLSCVSLPGLATGIVAIVFASKVNSSLAAGDMEGALRASKTAMIWCWVTTAFILLALVTFTYMWSTGRFQEQFQRFEQVMEQVRQQQQ